MITEPKQDKGFMTAAELRQQFTPEYIEEQKKKYEQENQASLELSIVGQIKCNFGRIVTAAKEGKHFIEIDSRNNCCLNEYGIKRFRELGYFVDLKDYRYTHEGREKTYTIITISW